MTKIEKSRLKYNYGKHLLKKYSLKQLEKLIRKYTLFKVAKRVGFSDWTVGNTLLKYGIKVRCPRRETLEHRRKISKALTGRKLSKEHIKKRTIGIRRLWKDPKFREKELKRRNEPKLLKKIGKKSRERWKNPSFRKKVIRAQNKGKRRPEARRKHRAITKRLWQDPEYVKKQIKASNVKINKTEKQFDRMLQELLPKEYKYVGDGEFILAGKNPDWLNINGQKKLIELYGNWWHKGQNPQDRIDLFKKYGYDTLVIWASELDNLDKVKNKVLKFNLIKKKLKKGG